MKKLAAFILALCLMVPVLSLADPVTIDLSEMSFEDLVALKNEVNAAIIATGESKDVAVPMGDYIVGRDIPAGAYKASMSRGAVVAMLVIYDKPDGDILGFYTTSEEDPEIGLIQLEDGNLLEITFAAFVFNKFAGLDF